MLENFRRQAILGGADFVEIEAGRKLDALLYHYLFEERLSPQEVMAQYPELTRRILQISTENKKSEVEHLFADRNYRFYQQLQHLNLSQSWARVEGRVLVVWGKGDYVSSPEDHILIQQMVNQYHPGQADLVEVEADHWFEVASDLQSAFDARTNNEPLPINLALFKGFTEWILGEG